jgi:hypothetical protein
VVITPAKAELSAWMTWNAFSVGAGSDVDAGSVVVASVVGGSVVGGSVVGGSVVVASVVVACSVVVVASVVVAAVVVVASVVVVAAVVVVASVVVAAAVVVVAGAVVVVAGVVVAAVVAGTVVEGVVGCAGSVVSCVGSGPVVSEGDVGNSVVDVAAVVGGRGCGVVLSALTSGKLSSLLSPSPPVNTIRAMMPRMTAAAPAATAMIAPGCCHHGPGGGSYSGSYW